MFRLRTLFVLFAVALLAGCEQIGGALGIDAPEKMAALREADGKAIGAACRHAGRAIEDCYALNKRADKSAVFSGWRDMNDYMRENKIDPVAPQIAPQPATKLAEKPAPPTGIEAVKARGRDASRTVGS